MQVCEKIVLPNLRLTADLQEVFEMNYVEYIRRDTEGSDFDTRRRAATELVRSLTAKFPQEVSSRLQLAHLFSTAHTALDQACTESYSAIASQLLRCCWPCKGPQ